MKTLLFLISSFLLSVSGSLAFGNGSEVSGGGGTVSAILKIGARQDWLALIEIPNALKDSRVGYLANIFLQLSTDPTAIRESKESFQEGVFRLIKNKGKMVFEISLPIVEKLGGIKVEKAMEIVVDMAIISASSKKMNFTDNEVSELKVKLNKQWGDLGTVDLGAEKVYLTICDALVMRAQLLTYGWSKLDILRPTREGLYNPEGQNLANKIFHFIVDPWSAPPEDWFLANGLAGFQVTRDKKYGDFILVLKELVHRQHFALETRVFNGLDQLDWQGQKSLTTGQIGSFVCALGNVLDNK